VNFDRGFLYHYSVILVVLHEESHVLSRTWSQMTHKTAEKAISGDVLAGSVVLSGQNMESNDSQDSRESNFRRRISRKCSVEWALHSPNLTPDSYLWSISRIMCTTTTLKQSRWLQQSQ